MDEIWDRKILRSRSSLAVVAGMKTPNDHAEPTRVERKEMYLVSIYNYTMRHINTKCKYFHLNIHLCIHVNV